MGVGDERDMCHEGKQPINAFLVVPGRTNTHDPHDKSNRNINIEFRGILSTI